MSDDLCIPFYIRDIHADVRAKKSATHCCVSRVVVGLPGFEPRLREPKPLVLPLHHSPIPNQTIFSFACCKDSANRIQRACSMLRCSLSSQCEIAFRAAKVRQIIQNSKFKIQNYLLRLSFFLFYLRKDVFLCLGRRTHALNSLNRDLPATIYIDAFLRRFVCELAAAQIEPALIIPHS